MRCSTHVLPARGLVAILFFALLAAAARPAPASFGEWASPAGDAEPRALTEPRFFVETIGVEGVGRSKGEVIVSESRLEEGSGYTESELREAVYRVRRLPFVLDADLSLGKGSERGRYRLLITVDEVESFFFGGDLVYRAVRGVAPLDDGLDDSLTAGVRFFAGRGLFFAAVGDGEDLQAGYERYRLFDRPLLLRLAFARQGCCAVELLEPGLDPAAGTWTATNESERFELILGIPLGGNHSLRLDAARLATPSAERRPFGEAGGALDASHLERREVELAWVYDTTDDPVFPRRGDAMTVGVGVARHQGGLAAGGVSRSVAMSSRRVALSLHGTRHWPLDPRQSAALSLELRLGRADVDNVPVRVAGLEAARLVSGDVETFEAEIGARYSRDLSPRRAVKRRGELRWETAARLLYLETSPAFEQPLWAVSASSTLAWRTSWGVVRVGFAVFDLDGEL